jgi:hypothetical protein
LIFHEKPMEDFNTIVVYHIDRRVALEKCLQPRNSGARLRNCRPRRVESTGASLARGMRIEGNDKRFVRIRSACHRV